jgi:hypothetical protein
LTSVIMSRLLKPFAELPLKLVAFDTIDNRDVSLQLLASSPPGTSASTATPLEQTMQRRGAPFVEIDGWRHGGLNE